MNSEKAQLNWFRTLLRKEAAMSLSMLSSSAMCLCSSNDGHGSGPEPGKEAQSERGLRGTDKEQPPKDVLMGSTGFWVY